MDLSEQQHRQFLYQHEGSSATAALDPSQSQSHDAYSYAHPYYQQLLQQQQQYYDCSSTQTYPRPDPASAEAAVAQLSQFGGTMVDGERRENGGPHHHPLHFPMEGDQTSIQRGGGGRMGGGPFRGGGRRGRGPFRGRGGGRGKSSRHPPRETGGAPTSFRGSGRGRMGSGGGGKEQDQTAPDSQPAPAVEQSSATGGGKQQALPAPAPPHFPLLPIAWCDICRVDCNSLQILEQHKNGKRHKKTVQRLEEIQKKQKLFAELQAKTMHDMILSGAVSEKVVEVGDVRKASSAPENITTTAVLSAQVGEAAETSDTVQMDNANNTYNPDSKPAVVLTAQQDLEPQVDEVQTTKCQLEPAKVGNVTDAPPSASSETVDHLTEGSMEPPRSDGFDRRRGGMKRKMTVGRGCKRLKGAEPVRGKAPERLKERPRVCTLCSVMCESLVVFESHLAGKKHLSKIKRFQGQDTVYGPITVYIPPNQPSSAHITPGREPLFFGLTSNEMLQHETYMGLNSLQAENNGFHQVVQGDHNRGAECGASESQSMEGLENLEGEIVPANEKNEIVITDNAEYQDTAAATAFALHFEAKQPLTLPIEATISDTEAAIRVTQDVLPAPEFSAPSGDDGVLPGFDTKMEQPTANSKQLTNVVETSIQ